MADVVVDASALVDALVGNPVGRRVTARLRGASLHAPSHLDAEVVSALARLNRAGALSVRQVRTRLQRLATAPVERHPLPRLAEGAWARRHNLRVLDAFYAELAVQLGGVALVTTDRGLASAAPGGELIE